GGPGGGGVPRCEPRLPGGGRHPDALHLRRRRHLAATSVDRAAAADRVALADRLRSGRPRWWLPALADPPFAGERAQPAGGLAPGRTERCGPAGLDRPLSATRRAAPLSLRASRCQ